MNRRKNSGGITALALGCAFFILVIGYFTWKLVGVIGGESQVQHACDSGTLNVARTALAAPQVLLNDPTLPPTNVNSGDTLPYQDFFALIGETSPDNTKGVDLLNVNRTLAQAFIVSDNAVTEGTDAALVHAEDVVMAAHALAGNLRSKLCSTPAVLSTAFTNLGQQNPLSMLNDFGSALQMNSMNVAWLNSGNNSSIYFDPSTISNTAYTALPTNAQAPIQPIPGYPIASPPSYVQGQVAIKILNNTDSIAFAVDRPQLNPNLVNLTDFNTGTTPPIGGQYPDGNVIPNDDLAYVPPNAFEVSCQATSNFDSKSGAQSNIVVNTLACAMIGSIGNGTVASIPAGYIGIMNGSASVPDSTNVVDSKDQDGFDVQLSQESGSTWVSDVITCPSHPELGPVSLFGDNLVSLFAWAQFANTAGYKGLNEEIFDKVSYDGSKDPLSAYGDSITKHRKTDIISPRIRIAATIQRNGVDITAPAAELRDYLALANATAHAYSFDPSSFELSTKKQVDRFLESANPDQKPVPGEMSALVAPNGVINSNWFYPLIDQAIASDDNGNSIEPSFLDNSISFIQAYYLPKAKSLEIASSLFPNGFDAINWAKFELMHLRKANKYHLSFNINYSVDNNGNQLTYMKSGKLYYPKRWGRNPFGNGSSYIKHCAVYYDSSSGSVVSEQGSYAIAASPAAMMADINQAANGAIVGPVDPNDPAKTDPIGSGDHTFDFNQPAFQTFLTALMQRVHQIKPSCSQQELLSALGFADSPSENNLLNSNIPALPPGQIGYLYMDQNTGNLTFGLNLPYADNAAIQNPDSDVSSSGIVLANPWQALAGRSGQNLDDLTYDSLIDTSKDGVYANYGDNHFHKSMWKCAGGRGYIQYKDAITFYPSSGYHNCLGTINIETDLRHVTVDQNDNINGNVSNVNFSWPN